MYLCLYQLYMYSRMLCTYIRKRKRKKKKKKTIASIQDIYKSQRGGIWYGTINIRGLFIILSLNFIWKCCWCSESIVCHFWIYISWWSIEMREGFFGKWYESDFIYEEIITANCSAKTNHHTNNHCLLLRPKVITWEKK